MKSISQKKNLSRSDQLQEWMPEEGGKAELVAASITSEILQKELKVGAKLPSLRQISSRLGIAYMTVRAGIARLEQEGIVESRHGSGIYYIREVVPTTVAAVHLDIYDPRKTYLYNLLPEFEKVLSAKGLNMEVIATRSGAEGIEDHAQIVSRWRRGELKGLLLVSRYPARQVLSLMATGIPFVWINDVFGKEPVCSVLIDHEGAFLSSFENFVAKDGERLPVYMVTTDNLSDKWSRYEQLATFAKVWPSDKLHKICLSSVEGAGKQVADLVEKLNTPCGLYLYGESLYREVTQELRKRKIQVPEQVRIVTSYLYSDEHTFEISPSGWEWPFQQIAQRALEWITEISTQPLSKPVVEYIPPIWREGRSVGVT